MQLVHLAGWVIRDAMAYLPVVKASFYFWQRLFGACFAWSQVVGQLPHTHLFGSFPLYFHQGHSQAPLQFLSQSLHHCLRLHHQHFQFLDLSDHHYLHPVKQPQEISCTLLHHQHFEGLRHHLSVFWLYESVYSSL